MYVPSHPLVKHWLAVARNKLSPPAVFRGALAELGRLLIYEASAEEGWLPVLEGQAETPSGIADVTFLDPGRPVKASILGTKGGAALYMRRRSPTHAGHT